MDGRCKDCKWWAMPQDDAGNRFDEMAERHGYGLCGKVIDGTRIVDRGDDAESVLTETMAYTMDGSAYMSQFFTGPEFGCVQYEPKDS